MHDIEAAAQRAEIEGQRTAIDQQAGEIEKLKTAGVGTGEENEELRDMLHALLQAIESSGRDGLAEAMQELDRKASALVEAAAMAPVAESAAEESVERVDEAPAKAAIAVGPVSIPPLEEADEADGAEIESATIVEPALEEIAEPITEAPEETALAATLEAGPEVVPGFTAETAAEIAAEINAGNSDDPPGSSLDEIMERVSRLVEETEAAIAMPVPRAPEATSGLGAEWVAKAVAEDLAEDMAEDMADDAVEAPAQLATGTDS